MARTSWFGSTCEAKDADGELVATSGGPSDVVIGYGELLPAVEQAIAGLLPGAELDSSSVRSRPMASGIPKPWSRSIGSEFPDDVAPGDRFEAEGEAGETVVLQVLEVLDDAVVVDRNHPLAGLALSLRVVVEATRPATSEELAEAAAALLARQAEDRSPELIPPGRLLKGGSRG